MGLTSWAQGANAPFDIAKSEKELEIMRGIFKTTLSLNWDDLQRNHFFDLAEIRYLYLSGQGAHFFMQVMDFFPPQMDLELFHDDAFISSLQMMEENLERIQENLKQKEMSVADFDSHRKSVEKQSASARVEREKEALQAQSEQLLKKQKEMEQQIQAQRAELVEKQKVLAQQFQAQKERTMKQQEVRRQKLPEIKVSLIEAIANYGDSLTVVNPDEYINLVFDTGGQYEIVSIQKSWIKDYKEGKLSLDQFKEKAIQYSMKGR